MKRFTLIDDKTNKIYEFGSTTMNIIFYVCIGIGILIGLLF